MLLVLSQFTLVLLVIVEHELHVKQTKLEVYTTTFILKHTTEIYKSTSTKLQI